MGGRLALVTPLFSHRQCIGCMGATSTLSESVLRGPTRQWCGGKTLPGAGDWGLHVRYGRAVGPPGGDGLAHAQTAREALRAPFLLCQRLVAGTRTRTRTRLGATHPSQYRRVQRIPRADCTEITSASRKGRTQTLSKDRGFLVHPAGGLHCSLDHEISWEVGVRGSVTNKSTSSAERPPTTTRLF